MNIKQNYKIVLGSIVLCAVISVSFIDPDMNSNPSKDETEIAGEDHHEKLLRHVVLFKFKEDATANDIAKVESAFKALPSKIPQIRGFEWGLNNSPEGLDKGFTHCFFLTFNSEEDREIYLPHPDHQAFGKVLKPYLEDVLVLDYWIKE